MMVGTLYCDSTQDGLDVSMTHLNESSQLDKQTCAEAAQFDRGMAWLDKFRLRRLRAATWQTVQGEVLEIGVGTGLNHEFYPPEARITAFDLDRSRVAWMRQHRWPHGPLCTADAQHLPFADQQFDTAVATLVFCSIPQPTRALQEVWRVLRPGGRLILLEHVRGQGPISRTLTDLLHPVWFALQGECHLNRDTAVTVADTGFTLDHVETHGRGVLQIMHALKVVGSG